jgi:hypothetical protein
MAIENVSHVARSIARELATHSATIAYFDDVNNQDAIIASATADQVSADYLERYYGGQLGYSLVYHEMGAHLISKEAFLEACEEELMIPRGEYFFVVPEDLYFQDRGYSILYGYPWFARYFGSTGDGGGGVRIYLPTGYAIQATNYLIDNETMQRRVASYGINNATILTWIDFWTKNYPLTGVLVRESDTQISDNTRWEATIKQTTSAGTSFSIPNSAFIDAGKFVFRVSAR